MPQTHVLAFGASTVTKRYTSWDRGEPRREWRALHHIYRHAPDLAPRPLEADFESVPPTVTMSIIAGQPLTGALTPAHIDGLIDALITLWSIPVDDFAGTEPWRDDLPVGQRLTDGPRPTTPAAAAAFDAAVAWWDGPDPALLRTPPPVMVLGHRDPHLANYLWDGRRIRIVDFEDAAISDPATELAMLTEHLSARDLDAEALCTRFDVDRERVRAGRRLWAMFWLSLLLPGVASAHRNPPGTAEAQAHRLLRLLDTA